MPEAVRRVAVGRYVLEVGRRGGTLLEPAEGVRDADGLASALDAPPPRPTPTVSDQLVAATAQAEQGLGVLRAAVEGTSFDDAHLATSVGLVLGALDRLDREGRFDEGLRVARDLLTLLVLLQRWADLVQSLGVVLEYADPLAVAWAEHELGTLHLAAGDVVSADRRLAAAERTRRGLPDAEGLAATEHNLAVLCGRLRELLREDGAAEPRRSTGRRRLASLLVLVLLLLGAGTAGAVLDPIDDPPPSESATVTQSPPVATRARLTVRVEGAGRITSRPAGIRCPGRCRSAFERERPVELRAEPAAGATLAGWRGACTGTGPCVVRLRGGRVAVATFREDPRPERVTVRVEPSPGGTISSVAGELDCGTRCVATFAPGTLVRLVAEPRPGFRFERWRGACGTSSRCVLTADADRTVGAAFAPVEQPDPTVTVTVQVLERSGTGTVTSAPAGLACADRVCSGTFPKSDGEVTLTAVPIEGSQFLAWDGACESTTETCTLRLDDDKEATVAFEQPVE